jgi:hypothetical protein
MDPRHADDAIVMLVADSYRGAPFRGCSSRPRPTAGLGVRTHAVGWLAWSASSRASDGW